MARIRFSQSNQPLSKKVKSKEFYLNEFRLKKLLLLNISLNILLIALSTVLILKF